MSHEHDTEPRTLQAGRYSDPESLQITLQAVRFYVQTGCETLVCVASVVGAVFAADRGYETLSWMMASVPLFWMFKQAITARKL